MSENVRGILVNRNQITSTCWEPIGAEESRKSDGCFQIKLEWGFETINLKLGD